MVTIWFYSLGFMITFSPLFLKLWRAKQLFNIKTLRKVHISNRKLLLLCAVVISIDAIIILVWQLTDPLKYYRVTLEVDKFGHIVESGDIVDLTPQVCLFVQHSLSMWSYFYLEDILATKPKT